MTEMQPTEMVKDHATDGPERLDRHLVAIGAFPTRSRAADAIARGTVFINGRKALKAGEMVAKGASVTIEDPARDYVSRAALKLVAGLDLAGIDPKGRQAIDLGSSTGGFSEVLLRRGAARVIGVEVGHGQLAEPLKGNTRLTNLEGLNARDLALHHLDGAVITLVVSDVSFISLKLAAPPALALAEPGAECLLLVKPQFEAGRAHVGKGGLVDPAIAETTAQALRDWLDTEPGWRATGLWPSPIAGGDGNTEYLLAGRKDR